MILGILASGNLGLRTVQSLWEMGTQPLFLFTDNASKGLISFASERGIPFFIGNPRNGKAMDMLSRLNLVPDLIFSINYLFLINRDLINYPSYGCVNFHGSLLPKYRGRTPHVWAIINNEQETGITAHFVDEGCDSGPIILQWPFKIGSELTGGEILSVFERQYPLVIRETLELFEKGTVLGSRQDENRATYFGKRISTDGIIDWNWQKERIYNWVRAQADPYPGAFTFYVGEKVIIDQVEFSETGYRFDTPNGLILVDGEHPEIKTPNGVLKIIKSRNHIVFRKGISLT